MSLKNRLASKSAGIGTSNPKVPPVNVSAQAPKTAPGQLLAFRGLMQDSDQKIEALERKLIDATSHEIPLYQLLEVKGRRRTLSTEEYSELKENLRQHALIAPISVRKLTEGSYEIISGHNRVAIFRELQRDRIPAFIIQTDGEGADIAAFYANLLHPALPDFEKYKGIKARQQRTGKSQKELAEEAGIDDSTVSRWMAFDALPESSQKLIAIAPRRLGAKAAAEFAKLISPKSLVAVNQSIQDVIAGRQSQEAALRSLRGNSTSTTRQATSVAIRSGKSTYCKVRSIDKTLRIDFASIDERTEIEQAIISVLNARAEEIKP